MKQTKEEKAIMECYKLLYSNSKPKADFDKLIKKAKLNEFGQKEIDFMKYKIDIKDYEKIINKIIKKYRFTGVKLQQFKNTIALGCSPTFK